MRFPRLSAACWVASLLLAGLAGSARVAAQNVRADAVQRRLDALVVDPKPSGGPRVLPSSAAHELENFLGVRPQYLVLPAQAAPLWSAETFRYEWASLKPPQVRVVEGDLVNLVEPALFQASLYLSATAEMSSRLGAKPGPYLNALSTFYALQIPYATNQAWSLTPLDETAAYYIIHALDTTKPFDFQLLGAIAKPGLDRKGIADFLDARLRLLYAGDSDLELLVAAQLSRLMDAAPADRAAAAIVGGDASELQPLESGIGAFRLEELFTPHVAAGDGGKSDEFRTRLLAIRDELVKNPQAYPHLPSRLRAIGALQHFAATTALSAFAEQPTSISSAPAKSMVVAEADAIRHAAFAWFEAEVKTRGGSAFALPKADSVGWDPYALSEQTSLAIETSLPWAKHVRVYVDDMGASASAADIVARCETAWREDQLLSEIGTRYGKPEFQVLTFPDTQGKGLLFTWSLKVRNEGEVVARVKLFSTAALARGGDGGGEGSPPGIAVNQSLPVRPLRFDAATTATLIEKLARGDFVESFTGLKPGVEPPQPGRVWVETLENTEFQVNKTVEIRWGSEPDARLRGTTAQEVWGCRKEPGRPWNWYGLSRLRVGDFIWHTDRGAIPITAIGLVKADVNCRRLLIGGTEPNTHVQKVIVRCDNETRLDKALHGILADTEVTTYEPAKTTQQEVGRPIGTLVAQPDHD